jgi:hypothetical protein
MNAKASAGSTSASAIAPKTVHTVEASTSAWIPP